MPEASSIPRDPTDPQTIFLDALTRMERVIVEDLRQRSPAGLTEMGGSTEALQRLEDRIVELHTQLKEAGERAEWQQEQVLESMTREVHGLRDDLHSFVRLMAATVVTLVVVLALLVLLRLG